jgi:hypothetical protein
MGDQQIVRRLELPMPCPISLAHRFDAIDDYMITSKWIGMFRDSIISEVYFSYAKLTDAMFKSFNGQEMIKRYDFFRNLYDIAQKGGAMPPETVKILERFSLDVLEPEQCGLLAVLASAVDLAVKHGNLQIVSDFGIKNYARGKPGKFPIKLFFRGQNYDWLRLIEDIEALQ